MGAASPHPGPESRRGSFWRDLPFRFSRWVFWVACLALFRYRARGAGREPRGAALYVSNHQSFLDPVLAGCGVRRVVHFMARRTLFAGLFGRMIRWVHAFPVERGRADLGAIRHAIETLRRGRSVLLFPEGTRSRDGRLGRFRGGYGFLARRAGVPIVPVYIEGSYRAWPPHQWLPGPSPIRVWFGAPIRLEAGEDDEALQRRVEAAIRELEAKAGESLPQ